MSTTSSSYTSEDDGVDDDDSDEDDDDEDDLDDGNEYDAILRADEKRRRKKQRKKRKKQLETPPQSVMVSLLDVRALRARNVRPPPHLSAESANSLGRGEGGTSAARLAEQRSLVLERPLHPKDVRVGTVCTAWVPASNRHERAVVVAVASASALRHVHSGSVSGAAAASSAAIAATSAASGSSLVPYGTSHDDDQDEDVPDEFRTITSASLLRRPPGTVAVRIRDRDVDPDDDDNDEDDLLRESGDFLGDDDEDGTASAAASSSKFAIGGADSFFDDAFDERGGRVKGLRTKTLQLPVEYLFTRPLIEEAPFVRVASAKFTPTGELKKQDLDIRHLPPVIEDDDDEDDEDGNEDDAAKKEKKQTKEREKERTATSSSERPTKAAAPSVGGGEDVEDDVLEVVLMATATAERACRAADRARALVPGAAVRTTEEEGEDDDEDEDNDHDPNDQERRGAPRGNASVVHSVSGEVYVGQTAPPDSEAAAAGAAGGAPEEGVPHGLGRIVFTDGNEYSGEWRGGVKHGVGEFLFPDGETYAGTYDQNSMTGCGVYVYATGDVYEVGEVIAVKLVHRNDRDTKDVIFMISHYFSFSFFFFFFSLFSGRVPQRRAARAGSLHYGQRQVHHRSLPARGAVQDQELPRCLRPAALLAVADEHARGAAAPTSETAAAP